MNYPLTALITRIKQAIRISFIVRAVVVCAILSNATSAHASYDRSSMEEKTLNVITSIKPIQWMVKDIMGDTGANVDVLLEDDQNRHLRSLRPSQRHKLASADIVFFIHNDFELFLGNKKPSSKSQYISLGALPSLRLLSIRESGAMPHVVEGAPFSLEKVNSKETSNHKNNEMVDWHIWFSPENAILMLKKITYILSDANPDKAMVYKSNFFDAKQEILALVKTTAEQLKPVLNKPFIVLHDRYQYFEEQYGLQSKATVLTGDNSLSEKKLTNIKAIINSENITTLLKEEQYSNRSLKNLVTELRLVELDSFGQGKAGQATSYVDFIRMLSNEFIFGLLND